MNDSYEDALNVFTVSIFGCLNSTWVLCVIFILLLFVSTRRRHGLPPGPPLWPVVGNLTSLISKEVDKTMESLRRKYGDIFSLYIGKEVVIILNGYDTIHTALVCNGRTFSARPRNALKDLLKEKGILFSNGEVWKQHRNFSQKVLKDICFENRACQLRQILKEEADYVVDEVSKAKEAIDIGRFISLYSLNIICRVVFGQRFTLEDPKALKFINSFHELAVEMSVMQVILNCFPFIQKLPGDLAKVKRFYSKQANFFAFAREFCEHSEKSKNCLTFCEAYQNEINKFSDKPNNTDNNTCFNEDQKEKTCLDLIGAASDTSANAIIWILLYLTREQPVQGKIFAEISRNVGVDRDLDLEDKDFLPYTQASILEGLRISSSTPFALPHSVTEDIYVNKFLIPKGCTVLPNLTSVLKSAQAFPEPEQFKPERFLSQDGKEVKIPKEFIAFSVGPRSCLGETLAKKEIFVIISTLMQKFKLVPENPGIMPSTAGQMSTVLKPKPFKVRVLKR